MIVFVVPTQKDIIQASIVDRDFFDFDLEL